MKVTPTELPDVLLIEPVIWRDARGLFLEVWRADRYGDAGMPAALVQENHSRSETGVLRGLHYQLERPQGKLVQAITGEVFDVAVDLRRSSSTFGRWAGTVLSGTNHRQLWIPPGFAHGFYVVEGPADVLYRCTEIYAPQEERTIRWDDPNLAIAWPLRDGRMPRLSPKDADGALLRTAETYS